MQSVLDIQYQRSRVPAKSRRRGRNSSNVNPPVEGRAVHPFVWWIWHQLNEQRVSQEVIAARAGVASSAMRKWREGIHAPTLPALEAVVNALGGRITIVWEDGTTAMRNG